MSIKVAINGYGRIGRGVHRQILEKEGIDVVAINSRAGADSHAYLLKHDSMYGECPSDIKVEGNDLRIDGKLVRVYQIKEPEDIDWTETDVDVVIECTGRFGDLEELEKHLKSGAKNVLITAPVKDEAVPNIVLGVNDKDYNPKDIHIISNASCTTNCLAPVMMVLNKEFEIEHAMVSTIHAFTYTQNLLDNSNPEEDFRRARATTESVIPTTTGAMKAISRVIPELKGKVDGMAFRVPVPTVSCIDVVAKVAKKVDEKTVNDAFRKYENAELKNILGTEDEPLVSVDFRGDRRSSIVDTQLTKVLGENYIKVVSWYDNEWGYVSRVVELAEWLMK